MPSTSESASSRSYRWADFTALEEDDQRELIDGALLEIDMRTELHEWVIAVLVRLLGNWTAEHGGMVLGSGYKIRVSDERGVMPDVQLYRTGNVRGHNPTGLTEGRPDLVVEVVSPSSRRHDRITKLRWYAELHVPEYWIIDPEARTLEQLLLSESSYRIDQALAGDAQFQPTSFPALNIALPLLWTLPE